MNIFTLLFSAWIALLPLVGWGGFYEEPKILTFYIASFLCVIYLVFLQKEGRHLLTKPDKIYFLWVGVLTLASIFGPHPLESVLGGSYRHQGVIFFTGLWAIGRLIRDLSDGGRLVLSKLIATGVLLQGLVILYQYLVSGLYFGRPLGTLGEPNAIAGYLILATYFVAIAVSKKYLLLIFVAALLTKSRVGILINALVISGFFWNYRKKLSYLYIALILLGGLIAIPFERRFESFTEDRLKYLKYGFQEYLKKPVLGYGAETGEYIYTHYYLRQNIDLSPLIIDRSHNLLLDILMWSGALGLFVFSWWIFEIYRKLDTTKMIVFTGFLLYSMFQPLSVVHWVLFIVLINFRDKLHLHRQDPLV